MTIRTLIGFGFLLVAPVALAGDVGPHILRPDQGPAVLQQCSRPTPQGIKDFFSPDPSQVAGLEKRLGPYLLRTQPTIQFRQYGREYIGFIQSGKRYIYGNFYKERGSASGPLAVCDGGNQYWGVVYSLDSGTFTDIQFNGEA